VFDETNGSQVDQVDLDELDDEEALCVALRNMSIGDVCPKESEEPPQAQDQPSSSMQASPPTQDEDQAQEDEDEDQNDEPTQEEDCWGLVLKCYELRTRQHKKKLMVNALCPSKHYFP
jgi:ribosomal protein L12E/L44/L45/RPP1/RPP2